MLFNSYQFVFLFLPFTLLVFYIFCRSGMIRAAVWWIGLASLFFYAYWNWHFLFLFIGSVIFNYWLGHYIISRESSRTKKQLLILGLILNLGLLAFYKYTDFFMQNFITMSHISFALPQIILPIGISFFTFTQIAFLVDCLQGHDKKYRFSDYLLFVSFFPHLIAGPILRHNAVIPQIYNQKLGQPSSRRIFIATLFFSIGLFKKVIIADNLATYVDPLFSNVSQLNTLDAWSAALLYTFQIYFDFSAYSEMAVGLALLMNIRIPLNFNSPYKARSIIDFWRRWHISLSSFLREYLYIPLGGNRKGPRRRYINLLATMLLGGLWHGAAWTYVVWGGLHGIYLTINHAWKKTGIQLPYVLSWVLTFFAVVIAWVFFRAQDFATAFILLKKMLSLNSSHTENLSNPFFILVCLIFLTGWTLVAPNTQQVAIVRQPQKILATCTALLLMIGILGLGHSDHFIYFQF